jgi:hypothetical protein
MSATLASFSVVFPGESDMIVGDIYKTMIGNGNAMPGEVDLVPARLFSS